MTPRAEIVTQVEHVLARMKFINFHGMATWASDCEIALTNALAALQDSPSPPRTESWEGDFGDPEGRQDSPSPSEEGLRDEVDIAAAEVVAELRRAMSLFGAFKNGHEGWAVIREEVDELWDEVKNNKRPDHVARQRKEAIQIAAMALRYVVDLGCVESTR